MNTYLYSVFPRFLAIGTLALSACANFDVYAVSAPAATGILGGLQFRVCQSKIRFSQLDFSIEGLVGPSKTATETKSFQVGKIGITAKQAEQINNIALTIDSLQEQMCTTTRDMAIRPGSAYDEYVKTRDARFERIFLALSSAQTALKEGKSQDVVNSELSKISQPQAK